MRYLHLDVAFQLNDNKKKKNQYGRYFPASANEFRLLFFNRQYFHPGWFIQFNTYS